MPTSLLHTYLFWIPCVQWDLMKCSQEWKHRLVLSSSLHQVLQSIRISEMHNTDLFCWIALATVIAKIEALLCWFQMEGECRWEKKSVDIHLLIWGFKLVCNKEYGEVEAEKNNNKQSHTIQVSITLHWQAWMYDKKTKAKRERRLLMLLSLQYS